MPNSYSSSTLHHSPINNRQSGGEAILLLLFFVHSRTSIHLLSVLVPPSLAPVGYS